jgi:hypothetical protein
MAEHLKSLAISEPLNFYSFKVNGNEIVAKDMYPSLNHPHAIDFFGFACMQQYGFWHDNGTGYDAPMLGTINGKQNVKGSDLLWKMCKNAMDEDSGVFLPKNLTRLSDKEIGDKIFRDDNGPVLFPDMSHRGDLTRAYGTYFHRRGTALSDIVAEANDAPASLSEFRDLVRDVPGYNTDPFEKKQLLLAMALTNRPEGFLKVNDPHNWDPIIDYHLMRLALRTGMIDLKQPWFGDDPELERKNKLREFVSSQDEYEIRDATYNVFQRIILETGLTMTQIDHLFWAGRRYCPEMEEADCAKCTLAPACEKKTDLFQPVYRTDAY